ncbi:MAG: hypothetical protein NTX88_03340 [Candidatus Atribacteria bacterium]|nr:hypothetical protein [Candidatus Atribacteria bacterium]
MQDEEHGIKEGKTLVILRKDFPVLFIDDELHGVQKRQLGVMMSLDKGGKWGDSMFPVMNSHLSTFPLYPYFLPLTAFSR